MRHPELVAAMSLEEKAAFVSGDGYWRTKALPRLGIPSVELSDGPHGLRKPGDMGGRADFSKLVPVTAFPTASLTACGFDPGLLSAMGEALGRECAKEGIAMILGPGANIKRSPLCGRNFEYFSEDPLLSSAMAAAWVRGVESMGVGTSLKHFAVNNQERRRMVIDAVLEPRALREIYLASFEGAVRGGRPSSVMCAYNRVNGVPCSESRFLQTEVLREEWGFGGLVVTDWGASGDRLRGLEAGVDLEMPESGPANASLIAAAVREGRLAEGILDASVDRILGFVLGKAAALKEAGAFTAEAHHGLARRIARESMVLLKNEGAALPLARGNRLAVVGELARSPRYQGSGSSFIAPTRLTSFLDALRDKDIAFDFEPGYRIDTDAPDARLAAAALSLARRTAARGEKLIIIIGLTEDRESEGFDREQLGLPGNQEALVPALAAACPDIVAVLVGGAPVETPWIGSVKALIAGYLGGQASGEAQCDLVLGDHNPSGKLAETWPLSLGDLPSSGNFPGGRDRVLHKEGIFVGYRYFATTGQAVRFPFGHGLSYTSFSFSRLELPGPAIRAGESTSAFVTLANTGGMTGKEVIQVYLSFPDSRIERPALSLAAFSKVELAPGEARRVELRVDARAFAHWEAGQGRFAVETGRVIVRAGGSSASLPLASELLVTDGIEPEAPPFHRLGALACAPAGAPAGARVDARPGAATAPNPIAAMSDTDFTALLGAPLPAERPTRPFCMDSTFGDMAGASRLVRLVRDIVVRRFTAESGARPGSTNARMLACMLDEMPVSRLVALSAGDFPEALARVLVAFANGRPLAGLALLPAAFGKRRR